MFDINLERAIREIEKMFSTQPPILAKAIEEILRKYWYPPFIRDERSYEDGYIKGLCVGKEKQADILKALKNESDTTLKLLAKINQFSEEDEQVRINKMADVLRNEISQIQKKAHTRAIKVAITIIENGGTAEDLKMLIVRSKTMAALKQHLSEEDK